MKKRLTLILALILAVPSAVLTGCGSEAETGGPQLAKVARGDILITVTADGNLVTPREVELRFGTAGTVKEVLVEEGDRVREGTLLARLGNTSQKMAIKTALYNMQLARNAEVLSGSKTVTSVDPGTFVVRRGCTKKLDYPYNYPNTSALRIFEQAQEDLEESRDFAEQGYYKEAAIELRMVQYELEVCVELLNAMTTSIETYPASTVTPTYEEKPDLPDDEYAFPNTTKAIERLQQVQESLANIRKLIGQGTYIELATALARAQEEMDTTHRAVKSTVGQRVRHSLSYPDTATSSDFLQSAQSSLIELRNRMEEGDYDAVEFAETLRLAQLDMQMSHDILENNEVIFESGLNLQEVEQYNLNLQLAALELEAAKKDLMETEILAPFDGTVVDVGVTIDDPLSAEDYSSRTAVKLVDTSTVKLDGIVDEVDIFKVKVGQKATITVDAIPDEELTGTVTFISPFGTEDESGVVSFAVTMELDPTDVELRDGLTATADIVIEDRENVLLIPIQAIITTPMGNIAIVVDETSGEPGPRPLVLGARDYEFAEVVSGLNEGDTVIIIDREAMEAGGGEGQPRGPHMGPPPGRPPLLR